MTEELLLMMPSNHSFIVSFILSIAPSKSVSSMKQLFLVAAVTFCISLLCTAQATSFSNEQLIINSWQGQRVEELLATWGKAADTHYYPEANIYEYIYRHQRSVYIRSSETRYKNRQGVEQVIRTPAEIKIYSCEVSFHASGKDKIIYTTRSTGNDCEEREALPEHISETWLANEKKKLLPIIAFTTKETKYGKQIASIRKDYNAYEAGLRKGDYIQKSTKYNNQQGVLQQEKLDTQRKLGFFSKEFKDYIFTFDATYHSSAYEMMSKRQRALWNVNQ